MKSAHRKAIREAGPFVIGSHQNIYALDPDDSLGALLDYLPHVRKEAIVAVLNEIAAEPEAVAVARERLLREAVKWVKRNDAPTFLYAVAEVYAKALRAAKRVKR